jgi:hypothetical protein
MGYRCRWIAVRAGDRAEVLSSLRFSIVQELREQVYDTGLYAVDMPGWFVVIGDGGEFMDLLERGQAEGFSGRNEVTLFCADDSDMYAEVSSYVGGVAAWCISYNGSVGAEAPALDGDVPASARSLLAAAIEEEKSAGEGAPAFDRIYEAVAEIARGIVGFRQDLTLSAGEHLPMYRLELVDRAHPAPAAIAPRESDRSALSLDAVIAAATKVLGPRGIETIVNEVGVVEIYVVVRAVTAPREPGEIAIAEARARGVEADEGDELLFPVYYLPEDEPKAVAQQRSGIATLLDIRSGALDAIQRELGM